MGVSGTSTGRAGAVGGVTMTSRTDERIPPSVEPTPWPAKRMTLLCWLFVLTVAVSAECAWLVWLQDAWTVAQTEALAAKHRLPRIHDGREQAEDSGLIAYSENIFRRSKRAALHIDRPLTGANLGALPIEQPTKFDLILNATTAPRSSPTESEGKGRIAPTLE